MTSTPSHWRRWNIEDPHPSYYDDYCTKKEYPKHAKIITAVDGNKNHNFVGMSFIRRRRQRIFTRLLPLRIYNLVINGEWTPKEYSITSQIWQDNNKSGWKLIQSVTENYRNE